MKLLKFINCDAPIVAPNQLALTLEQQRVSVVNCKTGSSSGNGQRGNAAPSKSWRLLPAAPSTGVCYWLLNDDNTPIGPVGEVLLAVGEAGGLGESSGLTPHGIDVAHVENVDFRSKMGKHLQRTREEYGQTFKTAAKSAALVMDAERLKVTRDEKFKRERERVVEAVENGEPLDRQARARMEKKGDGESSKTKNTSRRR